MSEEKHIELNILNVSDETVTFKIAKQTHFRKDFCQLLIQKRIRKNDILNFYN